MWTTYGACPPRLCLRPCGAPPPSAYVFCPRWQPYDAVGLTVHPTCEPSSRLSVISIVRVGPFVSIFGRAGNGLRFVGSLGSCWWGPTGRRQPRFRCAGLECTSRRPDPCCAHALCFVLPCRNDPCDLTLGRAESCGVTLRSLAGGRGCLFSRQHAIVRCVDGVFEVEDISVNGTFINNIRSVCPWTDSRQFRWSAGGGGGGDTPVRA